MNQRGTPKTLNEAIKNALDDMLPHCDDPKVIATGVEVHVRDFLAQRFGVYTLSQNEDVSYVLVKLWNEIIAKS